jgi:hypothetical protein
MIESTYLYLHTMLTDSVGDLELLFIGHNSLCSIL